MLINLEHPEMITLKISNEIACDSISETMELKGYQIVICGAGAQSQTAAFATLTNMSELQSKKKDFKKTSA